MPLDQVGEEMGTVLGQLYGGYTSAFAWLAPVWHLAAVVVIALAFIGGNRYRRPFAVYFLVQYVWTFAFVGVWVTYELVRQLGPAVLAMYGPTPVFLALIAWELVREVLDPQLDVEFARARLWRYLVSAPIMLWALWYPPYVWGAGFDFAPRSLIFGVYGLMSCPITMMALGALFLTYPKGNKRLFNALTAYSLFAGAGMVALKWLPDVPFFAMGVAALLLVIGVRLARSRQATA